MTTTESSRITYGPWTPWGPKFHTLSKLAEWPIGQWEQDTTGFKVNPPYRCRQVFLADTESTVEPVTPPESNGQPSSHPAMVGEHRWKTSYADCPVPQDFELQELMWELNILREDIDLDWEKYWVYFVRENHEGDVISAVRACQRNRKPPIGVGGWSTTFGYVQRQVESHQEKYGPK